MELPDVETLLDNLESYLKVQDGEELLHVQRGVLYACLQKANVSYRQMPNLLIEGGYGAYKEKNLKNAGSAIFQRLSRVYDDEVKKNNCHHKLMSWYRQWRSHSETISSSVSSSAQHSSEQSTKNAAHPMLLQCWNKDVADLTRRIRQGHRIICIYGADSVGKTHFTRLLIQQIASEFDTVIQCESAAEVPTIPRLYDYVSRQMLLEHGETSAIAALSELLHTQRILLCIDHTEWLFQPLTLAGEFRRDCKGYEDWLNRLLSNPFLEGCLVWVGREPPKCFDIPPAYTHRINRLQNEDAQALLKAEEIPIEAIAGWEQLVDFCRGNPAWLLRQASHLQRLSPGGIYSFLSNPTLDRNVEDDLRHSLKRLSKTEYLLLVWLLLKPMSYEHVQHLKVPGILSQDLMHALASLERRDLIRQNAKQRYQLDSPLLERVLANDIVEQTSAELSGAPLDMLCRYPLFHGSASASRQIWQHKYLLHATARRFQDHIYRLPSEQIQKIRELLLHIRELPQPGYATSNLLNLAIALKISLAEFDLSRLHLQHVDLRCADLHHANLEACTFEDTLFPLELTGKLSADMAPNGEAIAVGDEDGHLFYWRWNGDSLRLQAFYQLTAPIDVVRFQHIDTLILVSNQVVYSWWMGNETAPKPITELADSASCLAHSDHHIAVGLTNGQIVVWEILKQQAQVLIGHQNPVYSLAFSPDGRSLASIGWESRVLVWTLDYDNRHGSSAGIPCNELSSGLRICAAVGWQNDKLIRAEVDASRIYLRVDTSLSQEYVFPDDDIITLHFSRNGDYLTGSTSNSLVFCWEWQNQNFRSIRQSTFYADVDNHATKSLQSIPGHVVTCEQGRWLMAIPDHQIQLYDLHYQEMIWDVQASSSKCSKCNLQSTQNLTFAERELMRSLGAILSKG